MLISDLTVEVRNSSLARIGQILPAELIGLELALRYNKVGAWKLTLRSHHPMVDSLRAAGGGIIVTGPNGVILSGPTASATNTKTADDPTGYWEIIGTDDSVILGERLAYPVPTTADLSLQTAAYDARTGAAETVVKAYVNANIGPSAPSARKISTLVIDTDLGRGVSVTGNARFETLGYLCERALTTSQLGFDIVQVGSQLKFYVYQPTDRTKSIRMDVDNLRLTKSEYSYTAPQATRVIVGGSGEGSARVLLERSSTDSVSAETSWGRRIEVFADQSNTSDTTALQQAADAILTDKGKTIEGINVSPSDDQTMSYGVDWGLGDKVSVVVNSNEIAKIVTEVAIVVTDSGVKIGATVGDPIIASASDMEAQILNAQTDQEGRISALERNDSTAAGAITTTKLADGAVTSAKIADGTIVDADVSASAAIAQSKISGLVSDLASKAPSNDPAFTGTPTSSILRLTSTGDASTTSTTHGLQIGDTAGLNVRFDNNEIMALNNGAVGTLHLQNDGGTVSIGNGTAATLDVNAGRITGTHYPYAVAAGNTGTFSMSGTAVTGVTVTLPTGRFTATPNVTVNLTTGAANSQKDVPRCYSRTSTTLTFGIWTGDQSSAAAHSASIDYIAIQMV